jgi:trehalose 6-phosphate synthase
LLPVVEKSGAIWVGSSGRVRDGNQKEPFAEVEALGAGALAMLDLPAAHYGGYYEGFANSALWPALHSRADLIRASQQDYASYREVNAFMARALLRFRKPDSVFWIQDYHFLALGAELRDLGVTQPIGFFLHTPWPARGVTGAVPHHRELIEAMLAYDLIGFQTEEDCENFLAYVHEDLGLVVVDGIVISRHGKTRAAVFPIGIDPEKFAQQAVKASTHPDVSRLRRSLNGERLAIGVDRLDYSKGLINRIKAFDRMWTLHPQLKRAVSLLQIATPSRGAIEAYGNLQSEVAKLVSDVNGTHGEVDWTPIRYLNKGYGQGVLAGLYRTAQVGVVTPLQDGMNLVAKEYVAAQNPTDPGVLVLSKFAGAANELDAALLVNPHDIDGMARTLATALSMPLVERRMRWEAMMTKLRASTIQQWFADFIDALQDTRTDGSAIGPIIPERPAIWPLRAVDLGARYR